MCRFCVISFYQLALDHPVVVHPLVVGRAAVAVADVAVDLAKVFSSSNTLHVTLLISCVVCFLGYVVLILCLCLDLYQFIKRFSSLDLAEVLEHVQVPEALPHDADVAFSLSLYIYIYTSLLYNIYIYIYICSHIHIICGGPSCRPGAPRRRTAGLGRHCAQSPSLYFT